MNTLTWQLHACAKCISVEAPHIAVDMWYYVILHSDTAHTYRTYIGLHLHWKLMWIQQWVWGIILDKRQSTKLLYERFCCAFNFPHFFRYVSLTKISKMVDEELCSLSIADMPAGRHVATTKHPIYTPDSSHHWSMVATIHQSPLGYVSNMVTYVTHPSSPHCGWSHQATDHPQWPLRGWVTYVTMLVTYPVATSGCWGASTSGDWSLVYRLGELNHGVHERKHAFYSDLKDWNEWPSDLDLWPMTLTYQNLDILPLIPHAKWQVVV